MKRLIGCAMLLCMAICWQACQKEPLATTQLPTHTAKTEQKAELRSDPDEYVQTLLGAKRNNPYTVTNMTEAWNHLYPDDQYASLPATHKYLKFTPADVDQLVAIIENDLDHFDYPVEYELIREGDYYLSPGKTLDDLPELYAVVPSADALPAGVGQYDLIEELVLPPYNSFLTAQAFTQLGLEYGHEGDSQDPEDCHEGCELYPYCLVCTEIGCDISDLATIVGLPGCRPGLPDWPDCLEEECTEEPPPPPPSGHCGCNIWANQRMISGCVQVEDSELGLEGVRRVQVIARDGWFTFKRTYTTDGGCFKIRHSVGRKNRLRLKLKFENQLVKARNLSGLRIWEYFFAVKDRRGVIPFPYNNISVVYRDSPDRKGRQKKNWMAAIALNGVGEFHQFAAQEGIVPPDKVHILNTTWFDGLGAGSAPMFRSSRRLTAISNFLDWIFKGDAPANFVSVWSGLLFDIALVTRNIPTDQLKSTLYHELAHASHYFWAGKDFWEKVVIHESAHGAVFQDPYGEPGKFLPGVSYVGHVAVAESWGTHIGESFAHLKYQTRNSIRGTWEDRLERTFLNNNYVPEGIYKDLIDDTPTETIPTGGTSLDNIL
ncbi:MAG: hypothetical protein AAFV25_26205, partial [Bacteroidota bacterium]